MAKRMPCTGCGELKWASKGKYAVLCTECRRKSPTYKRRHLSLPQKWVCRNCGQECERPAVRGQRPRLCPPCRDDRSWISDTRRMAIYERDSWICWLCEKPVHLGLKGTHSNWRPSIDHVVPRSLGGGDGDENLKTSHWICNAARGNRAPLPVTT